jgi:O-antigen/teichoic acid export membrane protein
MKVTNIAKNTSYFTLALVFQKVISFTYFLLLAKFLFPEDLGKYFFAISFTTIFSIFIDIGLANVLSREVPKRNNEAGKLLSQVLTIKIPLAIISSLAVIILINILNYPDLTKQLVYISSAAMILDSFTLSFYAVIRGFHNLSFESIGSVIFQLIILIFGFFVIKLNLGLKYLMIITVSASIFNFIFSLFWLKIKFKIKIKIDFDKILLKQIILITAPFAIYGILQRLFTYFDTVLLSYFSGDKYVGLYQIASKTIFAFQFIPMAFTASLYPAFSSYWKFNREQLSISFERAINYLTVISLPISVGIICLADKIIALFKPEYMNSILPLQITIIALFFIFINYPIGSLLNACDKQRTNTINMLIILCISLILNFILIPRFNTIGASITVVICNIVMTVLGLYWAPKITKFSWPKILTILFKALISVFIMGIFVFYLKNKLNIILVITIGGIIYFTLLLLLGGVKKEDIFSIYKSFAKK